jgi:hypothetical protein
MFSFAGISNVTSAQLDMVERIVQTLAALGDPEKLKQNALMLKREQEAALKTMAEAADAQRALEQARAVHERQAAELQAKAQDLESREARLNQLAAQVAEQKEALANAKRELREKLKAA